MMITIPDLSPLPRLFSLLGMLNMMITIRIERGIRFPPSLLGMLNMMITILTAKRVQVVPCLLGMLNMMITILFV
mgnify:CR=1 FL=1